MAERIAPKMLLQQLAPQLPDGISIVAAEEVGMALPALQADVRFAEYVVDVASCADATATSMAKTGSVAAATDVATTIERFLAAASIPWEHKREDEVKSYDIRAAGRVRSK